MQFKSVLNYLWKLPVCGIAFSVGLMLGSMVATGMGLPTPDLPAGTQQATLAQYALLGSLLLALTLVSVSRGLSGSFVSASATT